MKTEEIVVGMMCISGRNPHGCYGIAYYLGKHSRMMVGLGECLSPNYY